jgi:hypothetical protein
MDKLSAVDASFRDYLLGIIDVKERDLDKLIDELLHHWAETEEEFVRRRHRELMRQGSPAAATYGRIATELRRRPVRVAPRSERQIRRLIYG